MSQDTLLQVGALGVAVAARASGAGAATQQAAMAAYGLGSQVGIALPFSRSQESEADHIGLILMAKAGYDPHAAVVLWQRMEAAQQGAAPPQWLSTHPANATRQQDLQGWMAEAERYYTPSGEPVALLPPIATAPGANDRDAATDGRSQLR